MNHSINHAPHAGFAYVLLSALVLTGCVQTQATMFDSNRRAPVPEDLVRIYRSTEAIQCTYEEIALIHAQGDVPFTNEHEMIVAAKQRAGKIGANGLVLGYIDEPSALAKVAGSLLWHVPDRRGEMIGVYVHDPCPPHEPEQDDSDRALSSSETK